MPVATFFRVIDDNQTIVDDLPAVNENSTLKRWIRGDYNTTHNAVPPSWITAWNQGRRHFREFNLLCPGGLHTVTALKAFLAAAHGHDHLVNNQVPGCDPIVIGELDGTCAFAAPQGAWNYVLGGEEPANSIPQILSAIIVEFTGLDMGIKIPEELKGGAQVKVLNPGSLTKGPIFAQKHGFALPDEVLAFLNPNA